MDQTALLDKAFKLFQTKEYKKAIKAFDTLLGKDAVAPWVKQKVGRFKEIAEKNCQAEPKKEPGSLKEISYLMNLGKYDEADAMLETLDVSESVKSFLRAEIAIEQENVDESVELLQQAIEANPANRGYALNSPSFAKYIKQEKFQFLRSKKA